MKMSVGRAFLPVPKGDNRYYLGSQQCEELLASINKEFAEVRIPFVGFGVRQWSTGFTVDLPGITRSGIRKTLEIKCEFDEGYLPSIGPSGVIVRSKVPVRTLHFRREGDFFDEVVWENLDLCLIDREQEQARYRPITHNGMILFHLGPDVSPGNYVPQLILPM